MCVFFYDCRKDFKKAVTINKIQINPTRKSLFLFLKIGDLPEMPSYTPRARIYRRNHG